MKKFDSLVNEVYSNILLEAPPAPGLDQTGGNPPAAAAPAAPAAPEPAAPAPAPEPEAPEPVSSEGLRNLVDLVQRALVISPDSLDAVDKAVFNDKVTIQNALEKQQKLSDIVDRLNPATTATED
jgi:3-oxoacyl-ACP reductase-like protein